MEQKSNEETRRGGWQVPPDVNPPGVRNNKERTMEIWKVNIREWGSYYIVAEDMNEAMEKLQNHTRRELENADVAFYIDSLELVEENAVA